MGKDQRDDPLPANAASDVEMSFSRPRYKHQAIQEELQAIADAGDADHNTMIVKLIELGVRVYVVLHDTPDLFRDLKEISNDASDHDPKIAANHRCCLYKDNKGRVFNVIVSGGTAGLAGTYKSNYVSFSGLEATMAAVVLSRSFSCLAEDSGLKPAYLSLILGLVLTEEISMVWTNVCLQVQGTPSIGAFAIQNLVIGDWPRKTVVFVLAMAGAAAGSDQQKYITLAGVGLAVYMLFVNLGCRAWKNMCLKKQGYMGCLSAPVASIRAFCIGLIFPYLGFREAESGGQVALESTLVSALLVALVFIVSDFDQVQKFILVGSELCNQDIINRVVGAWYALSLLSCLCCYKRVVPESDKKSPNSQEREPFLIEDDSSPVGYRVPHIADFYIDPALRTTSFRIFNEMSDLIIGAIMAVTIGGVIIGMSFSNVDENFFSGQGLGNRI